MNSMPRFPFFLVLSWVNNLFLRDCNFNNFFFGRVNNSFANVPQILFPLLLYCIYVLLCYAIMHVRIF